MAYNFIWISKHDPVVKDAYENLTLLINEIQEDLRESYYTFQFKPVGSYSNNVITYDHRSNIGFDFDINIYPNDEDERFTPKEIKHIFKRALDKHCFKYGFDYAEDSTRVLTIKVKDRSLSRILYSVDFCFVHDYKNEEGDYCQEYIRYNKKDGSYTWEEQPYGFYGLEERLDWIRKNRHWDELVDYYVDKKNVNTNPNNKSRSIFATAAKEICDKYGHNL